MILLHHSTILSCLSVRMNGQPEVGWLIPTIPATSNNSLCKAPGDLLPALGMHQGKMGQEDGCEAG